MLTKVATDPLVEDVLDLYHGHGVYEAVLADEDVETDKKSVMFFI